jgi:hypothetical protein
MEPTRFDAAISAIDRANAEDPNTVQVDGSERPKELIHAERMTFWVERLDPRADEAQLLAARAHHFRRWVMPRSSYPPGRAGYLRWRRDQKVRQASEVGELLAAEGYPDEIVGRVQHIIRKDGLGIDPAVQVHEDALCLVFLQEQLGPVAAELGDAKALAVLRKTLGKMSSRAVEEAMTLPLSAAGRALLHAATVD